MQVTISRSAKDSKYLANSTYERQTLVVDLETGELLWYYDPPLHYVGNALPVSFCRAGKHFIYHDETGKEHVVNVGSWNEASECNDRAPVTRLLLGWPLRELTGKKVLVGLDERVKLWPPDSDGAIPVLETKDGVGHWICVSPDRRLVAFSSGKEDVGPVIQVIDRASGETLQAFPVDHMMVGCGFSPDSSCIPALEYSGQIRLVDIASGQTKGVLPGEEVYSGSGAVYFNDTGTRVGAVFGDGKICTFGTASCTKLKEFGEPYDAVGGVFSSDLSLCATGFQAARIRVYDVAMEALLYERPSRGAVLSAVAFNSDGTLLVTTSCDGTANLLDARSGDEIVTYGVQNGGISSAAISPDETRLITVGWGDVVVWDLPSGAMLLSLKRLLGTSAVVSYGADGTFLVLGECREMRCPSGIPLEHGGLPRR